MLPMPVRVPPIVKAKSVDVVTREADSPAPAPMRPNLSLPNLVKAKSANDMTMTATEYIERKGAAVMTAAEYIENFSSLEVDSSDEDADGDKESKSLPETEIVKNFPLPPQSRAPSKSVGHNDLPRSKSSLWLSAKQFGSPPPLALFATTTGGSHKFLLGTNAPTRLSDNYAEAAQQEETMRYDSNCIAF